jgi:acyl-CoA thioesterase FadM
LPTPVYTFRSKRRVRLEDTDLTGFVHFARILVFAEDAEHEFLASTLGNPFPEVDGRRIGWPRRRVTCSFRQPLSLGDEVDLHLTFKFGTASLDYSFSLFKGSYLVAEGHITLGCSAINGSLLESIPIPEEIKNRFDLLNQDKP